MFKLAIIVGTDRPNSKSQDMAVYVKEQYRERGVDAHIFSMADFRTAWTESRRLAKQQANKKNPGMGLSV